MSSTSEHFTEQDENIDPQPYTRSYHILQSTPVCKSTSANAAFRPPAFTPLPSNQLALPTPIHSQQQYYQSSSYMMPPAPPLLPSENDPMAIFDFVIPGNESAAFPISKSTKRVLDFKDKGPSPKSAKPSFEVTDVEAPECFTVDARIGVELDMLIHQFDLEGTLTLNERTRLYRCLVTYLVKAKSPPCTEYEVSNMTVHAAIQVIHRSTYDRSEFLPLRLERYDGDVEKNLHMVDRRVIRSLEVYWLEVRPNFLPQEGLSKKKISFINGTGHVCYLYSQFFFVNNLGNDLFRLRQVSFAVKNEMKKLVMDADRRNLDVLKRKIQLMLPARHDPCYEIPSAAVLLNAINQVRQNRRLCAYKKYLLTTKTTVNKFLFTGY